MRLRIIGPDVFGQIKHPDRAADGGLVLADPPRDLFLGHAELAHEPAVTLCFFQRVQVLALHVLDDLHLQPPMLLHGTDDGRHGGETQVTGGRVAPLAGQEPVTFLARNGDDDRLDDARVLDGSLQLGQIAQVLAGLVRVRLDLLDGKFGQQGTVPVEQAKRACYPFSARVLFEVVLELFGCCAVGHILVISFTSA